VVEDWDSIAELGAKAWAPVDGIRLVHCWGSSTYRLRCRTSPLPFHLFTSLNLRLAMLNPKIWRCCGWDRSVDQSSGFWASSKRWSRRTVPAWYS